MTPKRHEIVIIGGGVAGLACAARLQENQLDLTLLEKDSEPGGNVRTTTEEGYRLEKGPHTFLASADAIFELVGSAGLEDALRNPLPSAKDRFIARAGRLHAAPTGPWSFLTTPLLSAGSKWTLATEPWRRARGSLDDTAATFFDRRFGPEAARVLAGAFISGVYAGDPQQLSAPAAFPLFWGFESETGSMVRGALRHKKRRREELAERGLTPRRGLFTFENGLGQFTSTLASRLDDRCHCGVEVASVQEVEQGYGITTASGDEWLAETVVVAAPPGPAARILEGLDQELAELLSGVPMAPVAVVHLGFSERAAEIPDGFGFLAPRNEGVRSLGVLFPSRLFDGRAKDDGDLLAGFVGGMLDAGALDLGDEQLVDIVLTDLKALTGMQQKPSFVRVRRYPAAIPQLVVGHLERKKSIIDRLSSHENLHLAGNYLLGVGMKDATASGLAVAERIVEDRSR